MRRSNLIILTIGAFVAGIAFTLTIGAGPSGTPAKDPHLNALLNLSGKQVEAINEADPGFDKEAEVLTNDLNSAKTQLADVLEDNNSTDDQIMAQVETTIAAHNALKRRVAKHILKIRDQLEPEQRSRLMGLCAEEVRASRRHQNRFGQGGDNAGHDGAGPGKGNGKGANGRGNQYRGGRGGE